MKNSGKKIRDMKRAHLFYSGTVQGVGFRWAVQDAADPLGLTGWVRNCPDGTVEVVCEGPKESIELFMNKVKKVMGYYVRAVRRDWQDATGEFDGFNITFCR